jgi:hypothetical protein
MTASLAGANLRAATRAVSRLRREARLDEVGELLAVLLRTSAALVDASTAPESDCAAYARAHVIRAHAGIVEQLARVIHPPNSDALGSFVASLTKLTGGSLDSPPPD